MYCSCILLFYFNEVYHVLYLGTACCSIVRKCIVYYTCCSVSRAITILELNWVDTTSRGNLDQPHSKKIKLDRAAGGEYFCH